MSELRRRSLDTTQLTILAALYSLRFCSRAILADYLHVPNTTSLYSRLLTLQRHNFIATHHETSYRLVGRGIEYYVTPEGLRALGEAGKLVVTDDMISALYRDKVASKDFIAEQLLIARMRNLLTSTYPGALQAFSARDTRTYPYFPHPHPDLFISMQNIGHVSRFFVEYCPARIPHSKLIQRLQYYNRYYDDDSWSESNTPFPVILLIAETKLGAAGLKRLASREHYRSDTDIAYYVTTQEQLLSVAPDHADVWIDALSKSAPAALSDL